MQMHAYYAVLQQRLLPLDISDFCLAIAPSPKKSWIYPWSY